MVEFRNEMKRLSGIFHNHDNHIGKLFSCVRFFSSVPTSICVATLVQIERTNSEGRARYNENANFVSKIDFYRNSHQLLPSEHAAVPVLGFEGTSTLKNFSSGLSIGVDLAR